MRRAWQAFRRAWSRRGHERTALVQVLKGITATLISYLLAVHLLDSQIPSFAPFAAILVVQVTVYRSVQHAAYYMTAVVVGVVCAGAIGETLGQDVLALAVLVTLTLVIGQWPRWGSYGPQVAIVGIFAFAAGGGDEPNYLLSLLTTVACGALTGALINIVFAPRIRFSDATTAVRDLGSGIGDLLGDIAEGLRSEEDPLSPVDGWQDHARRLGDTVDRARREIDFAKENTRLNPRRLTQPSLPFADTRRTVDVLAWIVSGVQSLTTALAHIDHQEDQPVDWDLLGDFFPRYADLLDAVANVVAAFSRPEHDGPSQLPAGVDSARRHHEDLAGSLREHVPRDSRTLANCGALLIDVERMLDHIDTARTPQ